MTQNFDANQTIRSAKGLTKTDTNILKALAILTIVLHNFFHVFPSWNIENEFDFKLERFQYLTNHISWNLLETIPLLLSYFGHLGVQVFIFLSAYGLYQSSRNTKIDTADFVWNRISKLYPAFFLAVCLLVFLTIMSGNEEKIGEFLFYCFLRLTLTSNFFPNQSFNPCGPWWFYSMIVQFYILFPLMLKMLRKYGIEIFALLSLITIAIEITWNDQLIEKGWFIKTTILGHLPIVSLGLYFGHKKNFAIHPLIFICSCFVFVLGFYSKILWHFSQVSIAVIILFLYMELKPRVGFLRNTLISGFILFISSISMYLFAVNGFLRHPFMLKLLNTDNIIFRLLILVAFVCFVIFVAVALKFAEENLRAFLKKINRTTKNIKSPGN